MGKRGEKITYQISHKNSTFLLFSFSIELSPYSTVKKSKRFIILTKYENWVR